MTKPSDWLPRPSGPRPPDTPSARADTGTGNCPPRCESVTIYIILKKTLRATLHLVTKSISDASVLQFKFTSKPNINLNCNKISGKKEEKALLEASDLRDIMIISMSQYITVMQILGSGKTKKLIQSRKS